MWPGFARICLCPCFTGLLCFFEISRHSTVVRRGNKKPLIVACAISQLVCFAGAVCRQSGFPHGAVRQSEKRMCRRELWIEFRCSLEEWHSRWLAARRQNLQSCTVGLERFERWRGRFGQRRIVLLHRRKRFTEVRPEPAGDFAQCAQHIFFSRRLHLFLCKDPAASAVLSA